MVKIEKIETGAPKGGPYSSGLKIGDFLFVSGQGPVNPRTKNMDENIQGQTLTTLNNLKEIVLSAGAKVADIVKTTVYMTNIGDFQPMNQVYQQFFIDNGAVDLFPTRTTVEVSNLAIPEMLIEIDCIAAIEKGGV